MLCRTAFFKTLTADVFQQLKWPTIYVILYNFVLQLNNSTANTQWLKKFPTLGSPITLTCQQIFIIYCRHTWQKICKQKLTLKLEKNNTWSNLNIVRIHFHIREKAFHEACCFYDLKHNPHVSIQTNANVQTDSRDCQSCQCRHLWEYFSLTITKFLQ